MIPLACDRCGHGRRHNIVPRLSRRAQRRVARRRSVRDRMRPRASREQFAESALAESPAASRSQRCTSRRCQPIARPRKRCGLGNCPTNTSAARIHRGRRVRRATSCAPRISFHAGSFSFTHFDKETLLRGTMAGAFVPNSDVSVRIRVRAHDLRFRSLRDELSLDDDHDVRRQESQPAESRKISTKLDPLFLTLLHSDWQAVWGCRASPKKPAKLGRTRLVRARAKADT